jgi:hypothetical protein
MPSVGTVGYQHTLSDLREHIYACLMQEESSTHFPKARVNKWINQVFDKMRLAHLYSMASDVFTVTVADTQTWVPPSEVWKLVGITYDWGGIDTPLALITHDQFDHLTDGDWDQQSGDPQYWHDAGDYIWFDKKMSVGKNLKFWYWERAQEITTDSELSGFYKVFLPVVVAGVLAIAMRADRKMDQHMSYNQEFKELIEQAKAHIIELHEADNVAHQIRDHQGFF